MPSFRRRLLMNVEKKYTPVEYLESTGTQYIDTGIYPKSTTRVVFNFELKESGCRNGWGSSYGAESYMWGTNGNGQYVSFVANDWTSSNTEIIADDKRHEFDLSSGHQKFDGIEYGTTQIGDTALSHQTLYLFATNVEWTKKPNSWCKEKVFSVKIYDGNRIMRDYIPTLDKNNRPCLYDKVEDKFYYNEGSGEFLYE